MRALVESARRANDRRLLRLLGEDPLIVPRQNSGFTTEPETDWRKWSEEDAAFANQTAEVGEAASRTRDRLALPQSTNGSAS